MFPSINVKDLSQGLSHRSPQLLNPLSQDVHSDLRKRNVKHVSSALSSHLRSPQVYCGSRFRASYFGMSGAQLQPPRSVLQLHTADFCTPLAHHDKHDNTVGYASHVVNVGWCDSFMGDFWGLYLWTTSVELGWIFAVFCGYQLSCHAPSFFVVTQSVPLLNWLTNCHRLPKRLSRRTKKMHLLSGILVL